MLTAVVSEQLDKGATRLVRVCSMCACEHPEEALRLPTFFLFFPILPRGLQ